MLMKSRGDGSSETNKSNGIRFTISMLMAIAHIIRFFISSKIIKWQNGGTKWRKETRYLPKNVRHFVVFAYIKNRMTCAIAINILNLKPFDFIVSNDPSPRFHKPAHKSTYFLRTYV